MKYTEFFDLYSGGFKKLEWDVIVIEGKEEEAAEIFKKRFDIDPYNASCKCCGSDYFISEMDQLPRTPRDKEVLVIRNKGRHLRVIK